MLSISLVVFVFLTTGFYKSLNVYSLPAKASKTINSVREISSFEAGDVDTDFNKGSDWIEIATKEKCSLILRKNPIFSLNNETFRNKETALLEIDEWFKNSLPNSSALKANAYESDVCDYDFWPEQFGKHFISKAVKPWDGRSEVCVAFLLSCEEVVNYVNGKGKGQSFKNWEALGDKINAWCLRNSSNTSAGWTVDKEGKICCNIKTGLVRPAMWVNSEIFERRVATQGRVIESQLANDIDSEHKSPSGWVEIATYKGGDNNYSLLLRQNVIEEVDFSTGKSNVQYVDSEIRSKINNWFFNLDENSVVKKFSVPNDSIYKTGKMFSLKKGEGLSIPLESEFGFNKNYLDFAFSLSYQEAKLYACGIEKNKTTYFNILDFIAQNNWEFIKDSKDHSTCLRSFPNGFLEKVSGIPAVCNSDNKIGVRPCVWVKSEIFNFKN
jgi:hypothetical protein